MASKSPITLPAENPTQQTGIIIPSGHTPKTLLGTGPDTGDQPAPHAVHPHYLVEIAGEAWPEVTHVTVEIHGGNVTSNFTLDAIYSLIAADPQNPNPDITTVGGANPDSRLAHLLHQITKQEFENPDLLNANLQRFIHRIPVDIYAMFSDKEDPKKADFGDPVFQGFVDRVYVNINKNLVTIWGRDYSGIFVDSFVHAQFRNNTTSGIVQEIGQSYEFDVSNVVTVDTPSGSFYDYENIRVENIPSGGLNTWDILGKLAAFDFFKVFTIGRKLFYVPIDSYHDIIEFELGVNIDEIEMFKNFTSSSSRIATEIGSTQMKEKNSVTATGGLSSKSSHGTGKGDVVTTRYFAPGMSPEMAGYLAESIALFLSQFEYVAIMHTTGARQQQIINKVHLHGTGLDFDTDKGRDYQITRLKWDLGWETGWRAEIALISLPPDSELSVHRKKFPRTFTTGRSRR